MKKLYVVISISLFSIILNSQETVLEWSNSIGGTGADSGNSITIDNLGNTYVTGRFSGTVDFDPSSVVFNLTSNGGDDIYIQKLDADGNFVWAKSLGGTSFDRGNVITTDSFGNVYVAGYFQLTTDFDPGPSSFNLSSNGLHDAFLLKLDSSGDFILARAFGSAGSNWFWGLNVDLNGDIILSGLFADLVDFDPSASTFFMNSGSSAEQDVVILKLDSNADFLWAKQIDGLESDENWSNTTDDLGNIYITGNFKGTTNFDPNNSNFSLTSNGDFDAFILKLNTSGNFLWAKSIGGNLLDKGYSIKTKGSNVYLSGRFESTVDFDPNASIFNMTSNGGFDSFVLKLNSDGDFIWAKSTGGISQDLGRALVIDSAGSIYVTGYFEGTVDFDPNASEQNFTSNGSADIFIQKLDSDGNLEYAQTFGGALYDLGYSIALDNLDNLYLTGEYRDVVDFDPSSSVFNMTSNGDLDGFVLKLSQTGLGIEENNFLKTIEIYPNPVNDILNINTKQSINNITIYNLIGQSVASYKDLTNNKIDVSLFSKGLYILNAEINGAIQSIKFVKE